MPGKDASARLASLCQGCSVGEMALLEKTNGFADVITDGDVEAYLHSADLALPLGGFRAAATTRAFHPIAERALRRST
jgi:hypothetical protein